MEVSRKTDYALRILSILVKNPDKVISVRDAAQASDVPYSFARVIQHEFDHLDGKVFTDHLSPFRKQMINSKLKALLQGKVRCNYRVKPPRK